MSKGNKIDLCTNATWILLFEKNFNKFLLLQQYIHSKTIKMRFRPFFVREKFVHTLFSKKDNFLFKMEVLTNNYCLFVGWVKSLNKKKLTMTLGPIILKLLVIRRKKHKIFSYTWIIINGLSVALNYHWITLKNKKNRKQK